MPVPTPTRISIGAVLIPFLAMTARGASGDADAGKTFFNQNCALCHSVYVDSKGTPIAGQGPGLAGVLGRPAASGGTFKYSAALSASGLTWDTATLARFLAAPSSAVPGTVMPLAVPGVADRQNVVAYLATLGTDKVLVGAAPAATFAPAGDSNDWRHDAPGVRHRILLSELPAPFSSPSAGNGPSVVRPPEGAFPSVPAGFEIKAYVTGLQGPRVVRVAPNGDIFIAETNHGRVVVLRGKDGSGEAPRQEVFASGLTGPFGIRFFPEDGNPKWVYVAETNDVIRYAYSSGDMKAAGAPEIVLPKLSPRAGGGHTSRDLAFSPDGTRMFVTVGSGSNVAEGMETKDPEEVRAWEAAHALGSAWGGEENRANILVSDPEGHAPLKYFATGIRNPVGLAINPTTGALWTSTNERDALGDDLVPDYVTSVKEGAFYGWPWYYMGSHEDPRHARERPDLAGHVTAPDVPFQSHSATLEIAYYTATSGSAVFPAEYKGDLFVACHGSWNRTNRTGYKVVRVLFKDGAPTGEYEDFVTGFVVDQGHVWGRPVGVAVAHDGALLVTEDGNGTLWRVTPAPAR
jgi:glucose/arabinose dehydrogenase/cytochrome c2